MNFSNNHCKIFITMDFKSHVKSRVLSYFIILTKKLHKNETQNNQRKKNQFYKQDHSNQWIYFHNKNH
jgi:hypothetical protein